MSDTVVGVDHSFNAADATALEAVDATVVAGDVASGLVVRGVEVRSPAVDAVIDGAVNAEDWLDLVVGDAEVENETSGSACDAEFVVEDTWDSEADVEESNLVVGDVEKEDTSLNVSGVVRVVVIDVAMGVEESDLAVGNVDDTTMDTSDEETAEITAFLLIILLLLYLAYTG